MNVSLVVIKKELSHNIDILSMLASKTDLNQVHYNQKLFTFVQ